MSKIKIDNKMRAYGDNDLETGIIRINKKKSKKDRGGVLDTLVHELMHEDHPMMYERNIRKQTRKRISRMSDKEKKKYYAKLS